MNDYRFHEDKDLDDFFLEWAYDPQELNARLVRAADGRSVIQMRVELGVLQMEVNYRPDGTAPHGFKTWLSYLKHLAVRSRGRFALTEEHLFEALRELRQYGYRRGCWLVLERYADVIRDADHSLALMNFFHDRAPDCFSQRFPEKECLPVFLHRAQAAAMLALRKDGPVRALEEIEYGVCQLLAEKKRAFSLPDRKNAVETLVQEHIRQLWELKSRIRRHYGLAPTLEEQMQTAVQNEHYEHAAVIRDALARRGTSDIALQADFRSEP